MLTPNCAAISSGVWLVSAGNVGYLDRDSYLFLCDRKRDMVISGGVNIYPAEIETTDRNGRCTRLCGFGIPDREYGERLCACIELERSATVSAFAIHAYLRGRLANFKVPKEIRFLDALPREETGKIFKRKLREPYWQDRSPASSIPTGTSLTST